MVADKLGFYKQEGLNVTILPGGPAVQKGVSVAQGTVNMGLADFSEFAAGVAHGAPLTWIAQVYQKDPIFYVSLKKAGITTPAQMKGRTFGELAPDDRYEPELLGMLQNAGVSPSEVKFTVGSFDISNILSGRADIQGARSYYHIAALTDKGLWPNGVNVLDPNKLGSAVAAQGILANSGWLSAHKAVAACFLKAALRGWTYSMTNPSGAAQIVLRYLPKGSSTPQDQLVDVKTTNDLVEPPGWPASGIFQIHMNTLRASVAKFIKFHVIPAPINLENTVDPTVLRAAQQLP